MKSEYVLQGGKNIFPVPGCVPVNVYNASITKVKLRGAYGRR